jgi:hypothetical protein
MVTLARRRGGFSRAELSLSTNRGTQYRQSAGVDEVIE